MPALITHVVLAQKLYPKHFSDKERKKFFLGTVYPDICRFAGVDRCTTHTGEQQLDLIKREESFAAGRKLHIFIDGVHLKYWLDGLAPAYGNSWLAYKAYKLAEDAALYGKFGNWPEISRHFDGIVSEERAFGIADDAIKRWHGFHRGYFAKGFSFKSIEEFGNHSRQSKEEINKLQEATRRMMNDRSVKERIRRFYGRFEEEAERAL